MAFPIKGKSCAHGSVHRRALASADIVDACAIAVHVPLLSIEFFETGASAPGELRAQSGIAFDPVQREQQFRIHPIDNSPVGSV